MALITPAAAGVTAHDVVASTLTRRDRDVKGLVLGRPRCSSPP